MLWRRATVYVPTLRGAFLLFAVLLTPPAWWFVKGESFLAVSAPVPADILVVEGWIGRDGVEFARDLFIKGRYSHIVAVAVEADGWRASDQIDFARAACAVLKAQGVPESALVAVPLPRIARNRTMAGALEVKRALNQRGISATGINVVSVGVHARRTRLSFQRVFSQQPVGVYSFDRPHPGETHWWDSTERSRVFLNESIAYLIALARV